MKLWPNKIPVNCTHCGKRLETRAGYSWRSREGWRSVCRSHACADALGLSPDEREAEVAKPPTKSTAELVGGQVVVRTPPPWECTVSPLPLLRALPGAQFDRDGKFWRCSADPQDRPRVVELLDRLECEFDAALRETGPNPRVEAALKRADGIPTLRPYQREGIEWLALRDNALLGDDMGLGKTLQTLVALDDGGRTVVVCPKSLKYVWRDEAALWRPDLRVTVLDGRGSFRVPEAGEIVVCNFAILPTEDETAERDLVDVTLVVDEAVAVKNFRRTYNRETGERGTKGSTRAKRIAALSAACGRVRLLTGTPLANRPPDLYGLLEAGGMAEEAFGHFGQFMRSFGARKNGWGRLEWGTPDASVPEKLRRVMIRRLKSEVLQDLPTKQYQWLAVNGENRTLTKKLDTLWDEWGDMIEDGGLPPFETFSAIRAALAAARIPHALEVAESYEDAGRPLVVFSAHRAPVDAFLARDGWAVITGDTPVAQRADIVKRFQAGGLKGVAITIAAGGTSLTLTAADTVLFVDLAWRPTDNAQAEDRICRIGQTADACHVIRMVSDHVLDRHVCKLLAEKQAMIEAAVEREYRYAAPKVDDAKVEPMFDAMTAAEREAERKAHQSMAERVLDRERAKAERKGRPFQLKLDDDQRDAICGAYGYMLSVCDGARTKDGAGFNASDAATAHNLAIFDLDDDQALSALCLMLRRYPGQLAHRFPAVFPQGIEEAS